MSFFDRDFVLKLLDMMQPANMLVLLQGRVESGLTLNVQELVVLQGVEPSPAKLLSLLLRFPFQAFSNFDERPSPPR